jgi:murein DD-endopeptidase MepM/ murein hydrolase activator NlpD
MVVIRHPGGYETYYLHLSSFGPGIKPGVHVTQKQVIGRVGMTGAATGPHLDLRIKMNGAFVNPLVVRSRMPPGEPIPAGRMGEFQRVRDQVLDELQSLVAANTAAVVKHVSEGP